MPYTGIAAALGVHVREGVLVAFAESNRDAELSGIRLELVTIDDQYEPQLTVQNAHVLVADKREVTLYTQAPAVPTVNLSNDTGGLDGITSDRPLWLAD